MSGNENNQWQGQQGSTSYSAQGQWTPPGGPPLPPQGQWIPPVGPPPPHQGQGNSGGQYPIPPTSMPPPPQGFSPHPPNPQGQVHPTPWGPNHAHSQPGQYGASPTNPMGPPPGAPNFQGPPPNWEPRPGQGPFPPPGMPPPGYRPPPPRFGRPPGPPLGWNQAHHPSQPLGGQNPPGGLRPNSQPSNSQPPFSPGHHSRPPRPLRYQGVQPHSVTMATRTPQAREMKEADKPTLSEDQAWVNTWLADRKKAPVKEKTAASSLTIPKARCLLREAIQLTDKLKDIIGKLDQEDIDDPEGLMSQSTEIKIRLSAIRNTLQSPDVVTGLQTKMCKIQRKRTRLQRQREERRLIKEEEEARRRQHDQEIDQWLQAISDKRAEEKREKEMKDAADLTLAEVRRKLVEARKGLDLLKSLSKLRRVRKETAKQKGFLVPKESDRMFEERLTNLRDRLTSQVEVYDAEKKTLEVMMETENQEDINRERGQERKRQVARLQRWEKQVRRHLFGPADKLDPTDPLYNFKSYYSSSDVSLEAFLQIRSGWDMFLVPPSAPGGSTVPCRWVEPVSPSSEVWKSALKSQQDIK